MNKHDHFGSDGYTLRTFLTVLEEASVQGQFYAFTYPLRLTAVSLLLVCY